MNQTYGHLIPKIVIRHKVQNGALSRLDNEPNVRWALSHKGTLYVVPKTSQKPHLLRGFLEGVLAVSNAFDDHLGNVA